jgi:hypothetical protein
VNRTLFLRNLSRILAFTLLLGLMAGTFVLQLPEAQASIPAGDITTVNIVWPTIQPRNWHSSAFYQGAWQYGSYRNEGFTGATLVGREDATLVIPFNATRTEVRNLLPTEIRFNNSTTNRIASAQLEWVVRGIIGPDTAAGLSVGDVFSASTSARFVAGTYELGLRLIRTDQATWKDMFITTSGSGTNNRVLNVAAWEKFNALGFPTINNGLLGGEGVNNERVSLATARTNITVPDSDLVTVTVHVEAPIPRVSDVIDFIEFNMGGTAVRQVASITPLVAMNFAVLPLSGPANFSSTTLVTSISNIDSRGDFAVFVQYAAGIWSGPLVLRAHPTAPTLLEIENGITWSANAPHTATASSGSGLQVRHTGNWGSSATGIPAGDSVSVRYPAVTALTGRTLNSAGAAAAISGTATMHGGTAVGSQALPESAVAFATAPEGRPTAPDTANLVWYFNDETLTLTGSGLSFAVIPTTGEQASWHHNSPLAGIRPGQRVWVSRDGGITHEVVTAPSRPAAPLSVRAAFVYNGDTISSVTLSGLTTVNAHRVYEYWCIDSEDWELITPGEFIAASVANITPDVFTQTLLVRLAGITGDASNARLASLPALVTIEARTTLALHSWYDNGATQLEFIGKNWLRKLASEDEILTHNTIAAPQTDVALPAETFNVRFWNAGTNVNTFALPVLANQFNHYTNNRTGIAGSLNVVEKFGDEFDPGLPLVTTRFINDRSGLNTTHVHNTGTSVTLRGSVINPPNGVTEWGFFIGEDLDTLLTAIGPSNKHVTNTPLSNFSVSPVSLRAHTKYFYVAYVRAGNTYHFGETLIFYTSGTAQNIPTPTENNNPPTVTAAAATVNAARTVITATGTVLYATNSTIQSYVDLRLQYGTTPTYNASWLDIPVSGTGTALNTTINVNTLLDNTNYWYRWVIVDSAGNERPSTPAVLFATTTSGGISQTIVGSNPDADQIIEMRNDMNTRTGTNNNYTLTTTASSITLTSSQILNLNSNGVMNGNVVFETQHGRVTIPYSHLQNLGNVTVSASVNPGRPIIAITGNPGRFVPLNVTYTNATDAANRNWISVTRNNIHHTLYNVIPGAAANEVTVSMRVNAPGTYTVNQATVRNAFDIDQFNPAQSWAFNENGAAGTVFAGINYNYVAFILNRNIMPLSGGNFLPSASVTRAQFAEWIVAAMGIDTLALGVSSVYTFADSAAAANLTPAQVRAINWCNMNGRQMDGGGDGQFGIIRGFNNAQGQRVFGPHDLVTREQMATMIVRLVQFLTNTTMQPGSTWFLDQSAINAQSHLTDVQRVVNAGIMGGSAVAGGVNFRPRANATRLELAKVLTLVVEYVRLTSN